MADNVHRLPGSHDNDPIVRLKQVEINILLKALQFVFTTEQITEDDITAIEQKLRSAIT